jgi:predicted RNA-binding protein (virulence factor B family)
MQVGKIHTLEVVSIADFGVYLDGKDRGKILLPGKDVPRGTEIGHSIEVFVYWDSEDRIIATTRMPLAQVGDFALLRCAATAEVGSFMDWGVPRDLFVAFREQKVRLVQGESYVVRVYEDPVSDRLAGSTKLHQFYDKTPAAFEVDQEVDLMILHRTDIGYAVLMDQRYQGMLYQNEVFKPLRRGDRCKGYVKLVREDGKVDLSLHLQGKEGSDSASELISRYLSEHGGTMPITDASSPEEIHRAFGMSKKLFKKALGSLLRRGLVSISDTEVALAAQEP